MKILLVLLSLFCLIPSVASAVTVTGLPAHHFFQQTGLQVDIALTGTYSGNPTAIEAKFNDGQYVVIDSSPSDGTYSGTLTAEAGLGTLSVRGVIEDTTPFEIYDIGIGDIYFAVGQSNALGMAQNLHSSPANPSTCLGAGWIEYVDPAPTNHSLGSCYPDLATELTTRKNYPIAVVNTADGSTNILQHQSYSDPGEPGPRTAARVTACGITNIAGILFYQGESDTGDQATADAYLPLLRTSLTYYKSMFTNDPPIFVARIHENWNNTQPVWTVQAAQVTAWEDTGTHQGADMQGVIAGSENGIIHWATDAEMLMLAGKWADAVEAVNPLGLGDASLDGSESAHL